MNTTTIGDAAGAIWRHLAEQKDQSAALSKLQRLKGLGPQEALAAIGWLARENKLRFEGEGRSLKVQLITAGTEAVTH